MGSRKKKILAAVVIALVVIGAAVGGVAAYLSAATGPVQNTLTPEQEVNPSIVETFNGLVKENVSVDVGEPGYAVYVRVAIVVTWRNGIEVLAQSPVEGTDYHMDLILDDPMDNTDNNDSWFYNPDDGFYYLKDMVNAGETEVLIDRCYQVNAAPDSSYNLHVEIIAQTIQALGTVDNSTIPAVTDAWGIRVGDNDCRLYHTVVVASGDSLDSLADAYGVDSYVLASLNAKTTGGITPGEVLYLPNLP